MGKIVTIKNNKGGVGKSTLSKNIAHGLALLENKVALITSDAQNDSLILLGKWFEDDKGLKHHIQTGEDVKIKIRENLDYLPVETDIFGNNLKKKIKAAFDKFKEEYDYIIVDCAPVFNVLNDVILEITDEIIVPIKLDKLSTAGIMRLINKAEGEKITLVVPNLVRNTRLNKKYYEDLNSFFSDTGVVLADPIPESVVEETLSEKGKTIFETGAKKAQPLQEIYGNIIGGIINE
ncbi:chromosome partitioning protein ParA [Propionigenium maris DSM 9537]|uniref:Chromosome partitioning protein ParA n=1 Tax=Propionigenium maris DSM 9537 TaxID=1123000 RepID=A0A9W6GPU5_9FUSO|nr:ParA family protein [Propionigenium maris]GLI57702.1 chromosome partitioning protein ParA [Propionigenium maris DSM 9537]